MADPAPVRAAPVPRGRGVRNPLSRVRVETAIARSAAGFGIAFMLQSIPAMVEQLPNMTSWWAFGSVAALVAALAFTAVASATVVLLRAAHVTFALVYLLALVTWPFAVVDTDAAPSASYWLYYLLTIATATATVGFGIKVATAYVVAVPLLYGAIRVSPAGGDVSYEQAALDSVYAIILGGAITILTTILKGAASSVDRAQAMALERYEHAVREHAIEAERTKVDAIVHDSVLTTLLSAARAETPETQELAARMAGNAIGHLRDAVSEEPPADADVDLSVLAMRLEDAASTLSEPIPIDARDARSGTIPLFAAEAVYSAAVQAMVNSLQHAGDGATRWVRLERIEGGVLVEVGDDGIGFEVDDVPVERLGVRVSIIDRLAGAGGSAVIDTAHGEGTRVRLAWPAGGEES